MFLDLNVIDSELDLKAKVVQFFDDLIEKALKNNA
jgi:hypothetical protein